MNSFIVNKNLQNFIAKDVANLSVPFRQCNNIEYESILLQPIKIKYITNKKAFQNSLLIHENTEL